MMKKTRKLLLTICLLCLSLVSGCVDQPSAEQTPAAFAANYLEAVRSGNEKLLAAYEGKTYRLNAEVDGIVFDEYISVKCADNALIRVYVPKDELETVSRGKVLALEGTVKEVQASKYGDTIRAEMILEPAHVVGNTFEITGEVEEIFHDWGRDGQDYAAIWDSGVVLDRQINIYLPEGHDIHVGDSLTARGTLMAPKDPDRFGVAFIRGRDVPVVFVMPEPELIQKEVSE